MEKLIKKFWTGNATSDEKRALLKELENSDTRIIALLSFFTHSSKDTVQKDTFHRVFRKIVKSTDGGRVHRRTTIYKVLAHAAVVLLTVLAGLISGSGNKVKIETQVIKTAKVTEYANVSKVVKTVRLKDGSILRLQPGAVVYEDSLYNKASRNLKLVTGSASFKVASSQNRPFSVKAGDVTTTALGTYFTVSSDKIKGIRVHLIEGKVVVRNDRNARFEDAYLVPGDELELRPGKANPALTHLKAYPEENRHLNTDRKTFPDLVFEQTQLSKVFKSLQLRYNVKIVVNSTVIDNRSFSGRITRNEILTQALDDVCLLNDLSYRRHADTIIITQK